MNIAVSESVDSNLGSSPGDFTIAGRSATTINQAEFDETTDDGTTSDDNNDYFRVELPSNNQADGTGVKEINYAGTSVSDGNGNNLKAAVDGTVSEVDFADPILLSVTGSSGSSVVTANFSEGVDDGSGALVAADFGYTDSSSSDASGISSVSHTAGNAKADLTLNNQLTSNDLNSDTVDATGAKDTSSNSNSEAAGSITITQASLAAGPDNGVLFEISGSASTNIVAGNASEVIGEIKLRDDDADSDAAFAGTTDINLPDGLKVNKSASTLSTSTIITSDNAGVDVTGVDVSSDRTTVTLNHSGTSLNGETIRIKSGSLVLEVNGSKLNTKGATTSGLPFKTNTFEGKSTFKGAFQVQQLNPSSSLSGSISVNSGQQTLAGGASFQIGSVDPTEIGDGKRSNSGSTTV